MTKLIEIATDLSSFDELSDLVNAAIEVLVAKAKPVTCQMIGLDDRAHYGDAWISEDDDYLIFKNARGSLDYYGGFEYVDARARKDFGDYRVYNRWEDERIEECINRANGVVEEDEED